MAVPLASVPPPNRRPIVREKGDAGEGTNLNGNEGKRNMKRSGTRNEGIVIKVKEQMSYVDALKNVLRKLGSDTVGINKVRRTRGGDTLLEMERNSTNTDKLRNKLNETMGNDTVIRKLTPLRFSSTETWIRRYLLKRQIFA